MSIAAIKLSKFNGDVAFVEAEAMEWEIQIAEKAGARCLIVESDSQEVVNLVNNRQGSRCEIFWVISEIQNLVKGFDHVNVKYTYRTYNAVTHSLAKLALERFETVVCMHSYPS